MAINLVRQNIVAVKLLTFKEEDIELFQDIGEKVKQTNSYDLAFEELEKKRLTSDCQRR